MTDASREPAEVAEVTLAVADLFDELGIDWLVGGSVASSVHGVPRTTLVVDFVADLQDGQVDRLVEQARDDFYVDGDMIRDALRRRASFNLLHLPTNLKIDVFIPRRDPLTATEMNRRQRIVVGSDPKQALWVASPEDIILPKLHWYQLGEEISERQWLDALGVLRVCKDLDRAYLDESSRQAGLEELWRRLQDAASG